IALSTICVQFFLISVRIISELPEGVIVLGRQTIGIYRRMHRPGMDRSQRKILVDNLYLIAISLQNIGKERLMHSGTEWALEIIVIYNHYLGIFVSPPRTPIKFNRFHWIGVEVHLLPADQRRVVL